MISTLSNVSSVLITGGAGFFGRALTQRLLTIPTITRICIYSRDEAKHALLRHSIADPDKRVRYLIGDVRNERRLIRACTSIDVVIHAAALKRVEAGIYNPDEMTRTNVLGSQNVVDATLASGARAVLISSDKACEPISIYGYTKALAEGVFWAGGDQFTVVRYGNVAGSTGSVIPVWRNALERGEPLLITNPECTRFWMTVEQAVNLVLRAVVTMPRNVLVPELPAYRLGDLYAAIKSFPPITDTGKRRPPIRDQLMPLPTWEKLHESMVPGQPSNTAQRMTIQEIQEALKHV